MENIKIKNWELLNTSPLRNASLEIAEAGLQAIDTKLIIRSLIQKNGELFTIGDESFSRNTIRNILVCGIGKCALQAALVIEEILGDDISGGVVLYIGEGKKTNRIQSIQGTHPLPSPQNMHGAKILVQSLKNLREDDLVIFIISGGGSTLLCLPEGDSCDEEIKIVKTLMMAGATIQELNTVRKHLSYARGGHLAEYAYPAKIRSLIFSDVPGNMLEFIASGPTIKDTTTTQDAEAILKKYKVQNCGLIETPKDDIFFKNVRNILAVSNETALQAMEREGRRLGFTTKICNTCLVGEARKVGQDIVEELHNAPPHTLLLYGGETTVTVHGKGHGGRNLELVTSALKTIRDDECLVSFASDGRDNGEYAGAICDIITKKALKEKELNENDFLDDNNEYALFNSIGNYLVTEDTGSNVSDLLIALKQ